MLKHEAEALEKLDKEEAEILEKIRKKELEIVGLKKFHSEITTTAYEEWNKQKAKISEEVEKENKVREEKRSR